MRKECFGIAVLLCLLAGVSSSAWAQAGGRINFGKLKVMPGIGVQEVYDDNIFLGNGSNNTDEREESDWITNVQPQLLLNYSLEERGTINLGYQGNYAYYNDNGQNDWKSHSILSGIDYTAPGGLILGLSNSYVDTADPYGSENQYKLGQQTKRWNDVLTTKLGYTFADRWRVIGYMNYYKQEYDLDQDFSQNYDSKEFGGGVQMRVMPKTWAFLSYLYGKREYNDTPPGTGVTAQNNTDLTWQRVNAGLTWDPGGKLRGDLSFGYAWEDPDNPVDPFGNQREDRKLWTAATRVSYVATATTTLNFTIQRTTRDSGANTAEYFEDTGVGIGLIQELYYRLSLTANFLYSMNEYNLPVANPKEQDNYLFTVGLDYKLLDWLIANTSYTYNRKDSNYSQDEYVVNRILVGLRAVY
ncbi:MAG: hypothetical protein C4576_31445 [Desulfobacteraceae bacterium]|nr:MAG: hypothetical protein C4576_31445 [Desulfobacteraceae bacterium]